VKTLNMLVIVVIAVTVGFAVGRLVLPLLALVGFALALRFHHPSGDEDLKGLLLLVLGVYVVGGLTVGTIARYVTRWARRARV
jgi:hypothetical protein